MKISISDLPCLYGNPQSGRVFRRLSTVQGDRRKNSDENGNKGIMRNEFLKELEMLIKLFSQSPLSFCFLFIPTIEFLCACHIHEFI